MQRTPRYYKIYIIIVKPKNLRQTATTTKGEVLKNIDPIKENLVLEQVKDLNNGALLFVALTIKNSRSFESPK